MTNDHTLRLQVYEMRGGPLDGQYMTFRAPAPNVYRHPMRPRAFLSMEPMPLSVSLPPSAHEYAISHPSAEIALSLDAVAEMGMKNATDYATDKAKAYGHVGLMRYSGEW